MLDRFSGAIIVISAVKGTKTRNDRPLEIGIKRIDFQLTRIGEDLKVLAELGWAQRQDAGCIFRRRARLRLDRRNMARDVVADRPHRTGEQVLMGQRLEQAPHSSEIFNHRRHRRCRRRPHSC